MDEQNTEYLRGIRDAQRDNLLAEHDRRLNSINGSIDRFERGQRDMNTRLAKMEIARGKETAVSEALAAYLDEQREEARTSISTKQLVVSAIGIVCAIIIPIIVALLLSGH